MAEDNMFTLTFGKEPETFIPRMIESQTIIDSFRQSKPSKQVYLITGVRGSGKTALLSHISHYFRNQEKWIVLDLNPESDLLEEMASELYMSNKTRPLFTKKELSISFHGITFSLEGERPITTPMSLIKMMLDRLKEKGYRVLIAIDEVSTTPQMKNFAQAFQILLREDYPLYLLMTGLYSRVRNLQNQPSLTFLLRVPRIALGNLNLSPIVSAYQTAFGFNREVAYSFAHLSKGYAYAFQVIGSLIYETKASVINDSFLTMLDQYLQEFVYKKIWTESSSKTKEIFIAIAKEGGTIKVGSLVEQLGTEHKNLSSYRADLLAEGLLESPSYGYLAFTLPRFDSFVLAESDN